MVFGGKWLLLQQRTRSGFKWSVFVLVWWFDIPAGVPQVSILGVLLFLIYIYDLLNDIKIKCKFFTDDTSLFSVVHDIDTSPNGLNHDLEKNNEWAF